MFVQKLLNSFPNLERKQIGTNRKYYFIVINLSELQKQHYEENLKLSEEGFTIPDLTSNFVEGFNGM